MTYPADLYAAVHVGNPGDIDFYVANVEGAKSALELGCGSGRVLAAMAQAFPDCRFVGVELDPGLAAMARARTEGLPNVVVHVGDMRRPPVHGPFDRVVVPYGGLYCLDDTEDLVRTLAAASALLTPGGMLYADGYAADGFHEHGEEGPEAEAPTRLGTVEVNGRAYDVTERSTWDRSAQRLVAEYRHQPRDGGPAVLGVLPQRYLLAEELLTAAMRAGLEPAGLWSSFAGDPYDPDDAEWMVVAALKPRPGSDPGPTVG